MKKFILLFSFLGLLSFTSSAQKCDGHVKVGDKEVETCTTSKVAAKVAIIDDNIEERTCEHTGNKYYVKKSVCETSGKVSFSPVKFDEANKVFVNVSPEETTEVKTAAVETTGKKKACCSKSAAVGEKKSCSKSAEAGAVKASTDKKACCKPGEEKACCKKS